MLLTADFACQILIMGTKRLYPFAFLQLFQGDCFLFGNLLCGDIQLFLEIRYSPYRYPQITEHGGRYRPGKSVLDRRRDQSRYFADKRVKEPND